MFSTRRIALLAGSLVLAATLAACAGDPAGPSADCYYNSAQGNSGSMSNDGFHLCTQAEPQTTTSNSAQ